MTRLRLLLALFAAMFALAFAPVALAQPAVAQKAIQEGDRAAAANKWPEALSAYEKAHKANPSAATAMKVANALYKLGRISDAHDAYETALKERGATMLGPDKKLANDRLNELKSKTGTVSIRVSEAGSAVTIDGKAVGTSPLAKPVRLEVGAHKLAVTKEGFAPFEKSVDVAAKAEVALDVALKEAGGKVVVSIKGGEALQIFVDGQEVGPSPWEGQLPAGPHAVSGRSATLITPVTNVEVKNGGVATVELVAQRGAGTLDVHVDTPKSRIFVDGQKVGDGTFKGDFVEGEHELKVEADGYEPFIKKVKIPSGEVVAETVTLHKATAGAVVEKPKALWTFDGVYGGFQIVGMFEPAGSGNTIGSHCEVLGATTCEDGLPMGGAIAGYVGYAFSPVGLELFILGGADVTKPHASYDGSTGSEVNPLVAQPAREEDFIIGRFGGGGAARLRLLAPFGRFRLTGALGAGLAYRHMLLGRKTTTTDGFASDTGNGDGDGYLTGVLSAELSGQVVLVGATAFVFGANLWLEHAGNGVISPARSDIYLTKDGENPQPQATPQYDMANGTQVFIGPFIGMHFGPY